MVNGKIILASGSPRRKELISLLFDNVEIAPADCEETVPRGLTAKETVEYLSSLKSDAASGGDDDVIITADTVVAYGASILGKPKDENDAFKMLSLLSGKTHQVYTGVTLRKGKVKKTFSEKTDVEFFSLGEEEIKKYIATGEPMDKAGAYGIQGKGCVLVKGINGDYFNVVGLPVARLSKEFSEFSKLLDRLSESEN